MQMFKDGGGFKRITQLLQWISLTFRPKERGPLSVRTARTGSQKLPPSSTQQEPVTPISAMKAALRPGSGTLTNPGPLTRALDSGSLSQPLLYGKSADGSLSEAGDQSNLPKLPLVPELAEAFAVLAWWLRLQVTSAVAHPSWSEALSNICGCMLGAFVLDPDQGHSFASPTGVVDAAHASEDRQLHKQAVIALCNTSSLLQLHVVHFLARILDVQPTAIQTLRPLGIWDVLCGPAFLLYGGSSPPAASTTAADPSRTSDSAAQASQQSEQGTSGEKAAPSAASESAGPQQAAASQGAGDAAPGGAGTSRDNAGASQAAETGGRMEPSPQLQTLRVAVISLLEKTACMRGLDNTNVEVTKVKVLLVPCINSGIPCLHGLTDISVPWRQYFNQPSLSA